MSIPARPRFPSLALALPLLAAPAAGQDVRHEVLGEDPYLALGSSVARAGDLDGDGVGDYWVGATSPWDWFVMPAGYADLRSGADGSLLCRLRSGDRSELFARALAAGEDLDGDGAPDVVVGAPRGRGQVAGAGAVYAFGAEDAPEGARSLDVRPVRIPRLWRVLGNASGDRLGQALAFLDDLDGDGVPELAIGAPGDDAAGVDAGSVRIVSGASGAQLAALHGLPGSAFGSSLARVGDLDGDGARDLLVGAPDGGLSVPGAGLAVVRSVRTGAVLRLLEGDAAGDRFGAAVALAGLVDGDGVPDLAVGAPGGGYARVLAGADGAELATHSRSLFELESFAAPIFEGGFGAAVCGVGDQDGDGRDDVAVGYPAHSSVWIFSGADGELLDLVASSHQPSMFVDPMSVYFGAALALLDDLDGDGRPELAVGAPADVETVSGQLTPDWDVGSVDVLSIAHDPSWERDVSRIAGAGDVDADGCDDVAYVRGGVLELRSGCGGALLRAWSGLAAHSVAPAGDADGDGVPDLVVGSLGMVRVLSGADGSELWNAGGLVAGDLFGASVAGIGDVDGDGHDDVAAGAPFVLSSFAGCDEGPGYARVLSGLDGSLLRHVDGFGLTPAFPYDCGWGPRSEAFGLSLSGAGDWNRDGTPDLAVGAPGGGVFLAGQARVFSGLDGSLLAEFDGSLGGELGIAVAGGPDFDTDADGFVDLVVGEQLVGYGPWSVTTGVARVFSSADESQIGGVGGTEPALGYGNLVGPGYAVSLVGDVDHDGRSDWAFGNPVAPGPLGPGVGEILVVSGAGGVLARHTGTSSWDYLGYALAAVGDADGDGTVDLLGLAWGTNGGSGPTSFARARVFAGE